MTPVDLIIRIALSFVLGGLIGAERQWRQRNAGLRTNTLVSVGSALFVSLSFFVEGEMSPTRVAAQVVSGIGFLGGGVILREGLNIRGLNTAATLWCSAATGALCGAGFLLAATVGSVAILSANVFLRPLAARLNRSQSDDAEENVTYQLQLECGKEDEIHVRALVLEAAQANGMTVRSMGTRRLTDPGRIRITAELLSVGRQDARMEKILTRLSLQPPVRTIRWRYRNENHGGRR
jgi:putative Mg2+ transporter-C (MgtC) family protein